MCCAAPWSRSAPLYSATTAARQVKHGPMLAADGCSCSLASSHLRQPSINVALTVYVGWVWCSCDHLTASVWLRQGMPRGYLELPLCNRIYAGQSPEHKGSGIEAGRVPCSRLKRCECHGACHFRHSELQCQIRITKPRTHTRTAEYEPTCTTTSTVMYRSVWFRVLHSLICLCHHCYDPPTLWASRAS